MKYLLLLHIFPIEIVNKIKIFNETKNANIIINFYRNRIVKKFIINKIIFSMLNNEDIFISFESLIQLEFILTNEWTRYYDRKFWCYFTTILSNLIMKRNIDINMNPEKNYFKFYNKYLKQFTKIWFKLCIKFNLMLDITYYNHKTKKANNSIILPAKKFKKPINNFYNILYTPLILYKKNEIINYNNAKFILGNYYTKYIFCIE